MSDKQGSAIPQSADKAPSLDETDDQVPLPSLCSTKNAFLQPLQNTSEQERKVPDVRRTITAV